MRAFRKGDTFLAISGAALIFSILLFAVSFLCFNSETFQTPHRIALEFGVASDLLANRVETYLRLPPPFYIRTLMPNLFKVNKEGTETRTSFIGLAPDGAPSHGYGVAEVEFISIDETDMPDFGPSPSQENLQSYIHIHKKMFPTYKRYSMMIFALMINNWMLIKLAVFAGGLSCIALGVGLRLKNKRASDIHRKNAVIVLLNGKESAGLSGNNFPPIQ